LALGGAFTLGAMIWSTTPQKGRQGIITKWTEEEEEGCGLVIDEAGCVSLQLGGDGRVWRISTGEPLMPRCWYFVTGSYDPQSGEARVRQDPFVSVTNAPVSVQATIVPAGVEQRSPVRSAVTDAPLVIAGWTERREGERVLVGGHFNGKIERPCVLGRALPHWEVQGIAEEPRGAHVIAAWDFSAQITRDGFRAFTEITDRSPNRLHGKTVNGPSRGVTGHKWSGTEFAYTKAPHEYGAIYFHDDDLDDARWERDFALTVPPGLRSGIYAAHLQAGGHEDYVPFFVRPPRGTATSRIAFLAPTNSYLAYANDQLGIDADTMQLAAGRTAILHKQDLHLNLHREFGASLYDLHTDGSGIGYASWRRPLLTVRPKYREAFGNVWQFNADLHLIDWFARCGFDVDVITDLDLHQEGVELLQHYRTVVTGSHPEYTSGPMLDACTAYLQCGGRLMYMGGNGFYWVTGYHPENPGVIEIRRWGGTQNWSAEPGECHLAFTGEMGGLWRNRGRPPQKLVGVGFIAQGLDVSSYYRRKPDSFAEEVAWIFDGIGDDELIGDFGLVGGGAAGLELDWYDPSLGSPPHAYLLASSEGHTNVMLEVRENFGITAPNLGGDEDPNVRADLVYFTTANGGAVFSTGSIAWCGSLSHNDYNNNVARITENVLRRFASDEALPS
jgi:N,N-dimethylformamidase